MFFFCVYIFFKTNSPPLVSLQTTLRKGCLERRPTMPPNITENLNESSFYLENFPTQTRGRKANDLWLYIPQIRATSTFEFTRTAKLCFDTPLSPGCLDVIKCRALIQALSLKMLPSQLLQELCSLSISLSLSMSQKTSC